MIGLKRETDYAIQLLNFLAAKKKGFSSLKKFADISGISFWFLQKIARKLSLAGMITAGQGIKGGYKLKSAKNLNLLEVIKAMEGRVVFAPCLCEDAVDCAGKNRKCFTKAVSAKINKGMVKMLRGVNIYAA
ncbi:Rrf2 family transcriptional regulator [Patescibacteria group bacterium]|nr:MAG: Rrf2 family transcriptional regulator [Patescibacteria group bacterium]